MIALCQKVSIHCKVYDTHQEASTAILKYIEGVYNRQRHTQLGPVFLEKFYNFCEKRILFYL